MKNMQPGFFSPLRWSPGSIAIVSILTALNALLILGGILLPSKILIYVSFISISVEILIVIIKGFEIIVILDKGEFKYEEKEGIALTNISPARDGVIKVRNELWSARSQEYIKKGERVIVEKQDGIYLIVKKVQ
jgi:membrane protein implicated in regulation of membrane protease activity